MLADKNRKPLTDAIQQNYARPIELFREHVESQDAITKAINASIRDGAASVDAAFKDAAQLVNAINK